MVKKTQNKQKETELVWWEKSNVLSSEILRDSGIPLLRHDGRVLDSRISTSHNVPDDGMPAGIGPITVRSMLRLPMVIVRVVFVVRMSSRPVNQRSILRSSRTCRRSIRRPSSDIPRSVICSWRDHSQGTDGFRVTRNPPRSI